MIALYNSIDDFKVSLRWLRLFLKRYGLVLRRRTKISQKLPEQTNELLENFNEFVINLRMENLSKCVISLIWTRYPFGSIWLVTLQSTKRVKKWYIYKEQAIKK